VIDLCASGWA